MTCNSRRSPDIQSTGQTCTHAVHPVQVSVIKCAIRSSSSRCFGDLPRLYATIYHIYSFSISPETAQFLLVNKCPRRRNSERCAEFFANPFALCERRFYIRNDNFLRGAT